MNQIRSRQIARLEKRALPHIKQRQGIAQQLLKVRRGAITHATVLALLVRYGNPQLGEPLSCACARVTESELWVLFRQKFPPDRTIYPDDFEYSFEPFTRDRVTIIGDALRHVSIATFPGANEKEKLNRVLRSAPPWLLWFTFADYSAKLLGVCTENLIRVDEVRESHKLTRCSRSYAPCLRSWSRHSGRRSALKQRTWRFGISLWCCAVRCAAGSGSQTTIGCS
jgi:hypothetical protein